MAKLDTTPHALIGATRERTIAMATAAMVGRRTATMAITPPARIGTTAMATKSLLSDNALPMAIAQAAAMAINRGAR